LSMMGCLLFATGALADVTIDPNYDLATDTWSYAVTMDAWDDSGVFQVYLGPNMQYSYLTGIGNSAGWNNPTNLGSGTSPWSTLTYLEWIRPLNNPNTTINFYFSDKVDSINLVNHPGPLVFTDPGNEYAFSTRSQGFYTFVWTDTSLGDGYEVHNAITPEPGTVALFSLGLLGVVARLRRRVT